MKWVWVCVIHIHILCHKKRMHHKGLSFKVHSQKSAFVSMSYSFRKFVYFSWLFTFRTRLHRCFRSETEDIFMILVKNQLWMYELNGEKNYRWNGKIIQTKEGKSKRTVEEMRKKIHCAFSGLCIATAFLTPTHDACMCLVLHPEQRASSSRNMCEKKRKKLLC